MYPSFLTLFIACWVALTDTSPILLMGNWPIKLIHCVCETSLSVHVSACWVS